MVISDPRKLMWSSVPMEDSEKIKGKKIERGKSHAEKTLTNMKWYRAIQTGAETTNSLTNFNIVGISED